MSDSDPDRTSFIKNHSLKAFAPPTGPGGGGTFVCFFPNGTTKGGLAVGNTERESIDKAIRIMKEQGYR